MVFSCIFTVYIENLFEFWSIHFTLLTYYLTAWFSIFCLFVFVCFVLYLQILVIDYLLGPSRYPHSRCYCVCISVWSVFWCLSMLRVVEFVEGCLIISFLRAWYSAICGVSYSTPLKHWGSKTLTSVIRISNYHLGIFGAQKLPNIRSKIFKFSIFISGMRAEVNCEIKTIINKIRLLQNLTSEFLY